MGLWKKVKMGGSGIRDGWRERRKRKKEIRQAKKRGNVNKAAVLAAGTGGAVVMAGVIGGLNSLLKSEGVVTEDGNMLSTIMNSLFATEQGLALVALAVGAVWTLFKTSDWWKEKTKGRFDKALGCVEAGVQHSYDVFVRETKLAGKDGKLTKEERAEAFKVATSAAKMFAKTQGLDLAKIIGEELYSHYVEAAVRKAKNGGNGK